MGTHPDATAVFDVNAIGLTNIVNNLNDGLEIGVNPMGSQTSFLLGVGANPGATNMDEEIHRLERKVAGGAEYLVNCIQLSAPFGRYQMAIDVAEAIGDR